MDTSKKRGQKVKKTLHLSAEAVDVLHFAGYCSDRTAGDFISGLIVDYHASVERAKQKPADGVPSPSKAEVAAELRRLAALLDGASPGHHGAEQ